MKKKLVAALCCAAVAVSLLGCGGEENAAAKDGAQGTESGAADDAAGSEGGAAADITWEPVNSLSLELDALSCVTSLADYSNVQVSLTGDYEVPQTYVDRAISGLLSSVGLSALEVTDRDTVQEGDVANIDYAGYLNGEAFAGGTAAGTDLEIGSGTFIPGFEDSLIGAKVGTTVTIDVTFPEVYKNNPDLAGQPVQFDVTINSIKAPVTLENLTDEMVEEYFSENYEFATVSGLSDYAWQYVEEQAVTSSIIEYMLKNSTVDIPEAYLDARIDETVEQQVAYYYGVDMVTFIAMLESSGSTLEEFKEDAREMTVETVSQELIFEAIGIREGLDTFDEGYDAFIQQNLDMTNCTTAEELYKLVGGDNAAYGEVYAKRMYVMNEALELVKKNATVTGAKVYTNKE